MPLKKLLYLNEIFSMFKCFIWSDILSDTSRLGRGQNNRPQFRPVDSFVVDASIFIDYINEIAKKKPLI